MHQTVESTPKIRQFKKQNIEFNCLSYKVPDEPTTYYLLVGQWTIQASRYVPRFADVIQNGKKIQSYTENATTNPVIPTQVIDNDFNGWMFRSEVPGWVALYGDRLHGPMLREDVVTRPYDTAFDVFLANGNAGQVWPPVAGWATAMRPATDPFGLWTHPNNLGPCGGSGRVGPSKICPIFASDYGMNNHADFTSSQKKLFLKAIDIEVITD